MEAASHLPKVDEHGLCDAYVMLKFDDEKHDTSQVSSPTHTFFALINFRLVKIASITQGTNT